MTKRSVGLLAAMFTLTPGIWSAAGLAPAPAHAMTSAPTPDPGPLAGLDSRTLLTVVIAREMEASKSRGFYTYASVEKSDRTGFHVWTERVAETAWGKVHLLIEEDGHPLSEQRQAEERARLDADARDPEAFKKREAQRAEDEQHARQMLTLLPRAFLFDPPQTEGESLLVRYRPNPSYQPSGIEERILHGMVGSVLIDARLGRVRQLEGRLPQDISIGFGLVATIRAGSNFSTTRMHEEGTDWKTETVHTDFNARAMLFKSIARQQEMRRSDYKLIPHNLSVADAVKLLEGARGPLPTL